MFGKQTPLLFIMKMTETHKLMLIYLPNGGCGDPKFTARIPYNKSLLSIQLTISSIINKEFKKNCVEQPDDLRVILQQSPHSIETHFITVMKN